MTVLPQTRRARPLLHSGNPPAPEVILALSPFSLSRAASRRCNDVTRPTSHKDAILPQGRIGGEGPQGRTLGLRGGLGWGPLVSTSLQLCSEKSGLGLGIVHTKVTSEP